MRGAGQCETVAYALHESQNDAREEPNGKEGQMHGKSVLRGRSCKRGVVIGIIAGTHAECEGSFCAMQSQELNLMRKRCLAAVHKYDSTHFVSQHTEYVSVFFGAVERFCALLCDKISG